MYQIARIDGHAVHDDRHVDVHEAGIAVRSGHACCKTLKPEGSHRTSVANCTITKQGNRTNALHQRSGVFPEGGRSARSRPDVLVDEDNRFGRAIDQLGQSSEPFSDRRWAWTGRVDLHRDGESDSDAELWEAASDPCASEAGDQLSYVQALDGIRNGWRVHSPKEVKQIRR
jgi:hypothetical protein